MELTVLLILPLVGGYAFSTMWVASYYRSARETGHRVHFRSVFYAVFLIIAAACIHVLIYVNQSLHVDYLHLLNLYDAILHNSTNEYVASQLDNIWCNQSLVSILVISFFIGPFAALGLNIIFWLPPVHRAFLLHTVKSNDFERLIAQSVYKSGLILVAQTSGDLHVGWVMRTPNPTNERRALGMLRIFGGMIDRENGHSIEITSDFYDHIQQCKQTSELDKLAVVIPTDQICYCQPVDLHLHWDMLFPDDIQEESELADSSDEQ